MGEGAFIGTALDVGVLRKRIYELTEPRLTVEIREKRRAGKRLLIIRVPEGLDVYSTGKGYFPRRWQDQCLPMRPQEVARLQDERRDVDWSSHVSERSFEELEAAPLQLMKSFLAKSSDEARRRLSTRADHEILLELGLMTEAGKLKNAAEVLLAPPLPGDITDLIVYQHRKTRAGEADHVARWQRPMLPALVDALATVSARIDSVPLTVSTGQQVQLEDYPVIAVREALVNALIHGDLREGRPVQVEHSPEALTVVSPGPLVSGITPENILTSGSRARFPLLATVMRVLGLAEELGQGVDRMFREMVKSGRDLPAVTVAGADSGMQETRIVFTGGAANIRLARFVAELPESERSDTDALLITRLLCEKRSVTARDVAPLIQRRQEEAEHVLRRLAHGEAGILEPTSGTASRRHPNYRLTGEAVASLGHAVTYSRRTTADADRKVVEHVRDYGTINNAAVQRLFDLDVYGARDVLRDLVDRQLLRKVSEQSRGPAVKYGRGEKFPKKVR